MPDLDLAVQISRDALGLEILDLNDHISFYCAASFLGGAEQWNRTKVASVFLDGDVTVFRTRGSVREPVVIEVRGGDAAEVYANTCALVAAFSQDSYALVARFGGALFTFDCEAADYTVVFTGPRWTALALQVSFNVPRKPTAVPVLV